MEKPRLSFWQIWNMSFGFLGIQFGWGLQMANMSAIYEYLGAEPDQIPLLWLAAPLTGLIVQPIIGYLSDHTWNPWWAPIGRRRPFFLIGALLSSGALILMPNSSTLWMAAGLLWILDASINVSMEPFRAFVADLLPEQQRNRGFAMQSLFIGLGAVVAYALPFILDKGVGVDAGATAGSIPPSVKLSFYVGAVAFLGAVLWTIFTTQEHPPEGEAVSDPPQAAREPRKGAGAIILAAREAVVEIVAAIREMPVTMRRLAWVQVFTWLGLFCMWIYFPVTVARHVFGAQDQSSPLYAQGVAWGGLCFAVYSGVCFAFSFFLPGIAQRLGRRLTHTLCLLAGAAGLVSVWAIHDKYLLFASMAGVGFAWASILSMPYAMLARTLPEEKTGLYMGIFNFFIVLPEIGVALGLGWVMRNLLGNDRLSAVVVGGVALALAAALMQRVPEDEDEDEEEDEAAQEETQQVAA